MGINSKEEKIESPDLAGLNEGVVTEVDNFRSRVFNAGLNPFARIKPGELVEDLRMSRL